MSSLPPQPLPPVQYPEPHADISQALSDLGLYAGQPKANASVYDALTAIEQGSVAVILKGSTDYERILTRRGELALIGPMYEWVWAGKAVPLTTLWERFPTLRNYLSSRTAHFIAAQRAGMALLSHGKINDAWISEQLERLESDLAAVNCLAADGLPA